MAHLKPYTIEIIYPEDTVSKVVLAYNTCHAVNLVYRHLDTLGLLNIARHGKVIEHVDFLSPNTFKNGSEY